MALKRSAVWHVFAGLLFVAAASVGAETECVRGASLAVGVNAANGRVVSIDATNGVAFAARRAVDLFSMELTRADDFSAKEKVGPAQAKRFRREKLPDGVRLVWEDLGGKVARVECTVKAAPGDEKVRFGISFVPTNGIARIATTKIEQMAKPKRRTGMIHLRRERRSPAKNGYIRRVKPI